VIHQARILGVTQRAFRPSRIAIDWKRHEQKETGALRNKRQEKYLP
jgi:hypothetical protein